MQTSGTLIRHSVFEEVVNLCFLVFIIDVICINSRSDIYIAFQCASLAWRRVWLGVVCALMMKSWVKSTRLQVTCADQLN